MGKLRSLITAVVAPRRWKSLISTSDELRVLMDQALTSTGQASASCVVLRSEGAPLIAAAGTTRKGGSTPVSLKSLYHVGSTQKSMTALLAALLVEQKKLAYATPLSELLPNVPPAYRDRTVLDLLLNRAGIVPFQRHDLEPPALVQEFWQEIPRCHRSPSAQREAIATAALRLPPTASPYYSNVGWVVLGHALELRAGVEYEHALETMILEPLGITHRKLGGWPDDTYGDCEPVGHYPPDHRPQSSSDVYRFPDWMTPAGGLNLDIEGYAAYLRDHLRGLRGSGRLLTQEGYRDLHRVQTTVDSAALYQGAPKGHRQALGLGWGAMKTVVGPVSLADGSGGTFYARLVVCPSLDVAFAGLSNDGEGRLVFGRVLEAVTGFKWD